MIRFPCGTCGKSLRAPETLAGRKGRCAQCGAVNRVPQIAEAPPAPEGPVVPVEVKRAAAAGGTSPFRSTADLHVRETITASVSLAEPGVLSDQPITEHRGESRDFFDHVASRLSDLGEPFGPERGAPAVEPAQVRAEAPAPRVAPEIDRRMPVELPPPRVTTRVAGVVGARPADAPRGDQSGGGAVAAALVIGGVVGFCAGMVAARWIQL